MYCGKGDNLYCVWLVVDVCLLVIIFDSCFMGGNDDIDVKMFLNSKGLGYLKIVICIYYVFVLVFEI